MEVWIIPLLAAIGGAAIALIGKELIEWYKRPRLEIDFEEVTEGKPYIPDYNDDEKQAQGYKDATYRIKYLRLVVHNKGRKPAKDCEAKLELVVNKEKKTKYLAILHWSRRANSHYAPMHLNIDEEEIIDVLRLPYWFYHSPKQNDHSWHSNPYIETVSLEQLVLSSNFSYHAKVTVYASNASPKSFSFKINWNGTVEGFNEAITRDED